MSKEKKIRKRLDEEMYILPVEEGCGKTGGKKFTKGSSEAKAHMAKIRAMRGKGKTGGAMICNENCESGEGYGAMSGGASEIPYGSIASVLASLVLPIVQHEIMSLYLKNKNKKQT
jgi:hypothetical protein